MVIKMNKNNLRELFYFINKINDPKIRSKSYSLFKSICGVYKIYITADDDIQQIHLETMQFQIGGLLAYMSTYALEHVCLLVREDLYDFYAKFNIK
jgi:hypothetical protein